MTEVKGIDVCQSTKCGQCGTRARCVCIEVDYRYYPESSGGLRDDQTEETICGKCLQRMVRVFEDGLQS